MTRSVDIPEAAVEAGARALGGHRFDGLAERSKIALRDESRAAIAAALPYLAPAGDGGLREALVKVLESPVELWHAKGFRVPAVPGTVLCALLDAHPAVPQPVDREALERDRANMVIVTAKAIQQGQAAEREKP